MCRETIESYIREQATWSVFGVNIAYITAKKYAFTLFLPILDSTTKNRTNDVCIKNVL